MSLSKERMLTIENLTMDLLREAYGENRDTIPPIDLNKIVKKVVYPGEPSPLDQLYCSMNEKPN
jgi:hypothetical protein